MRRADREVTEREEILSIIRQCDVCRLALNNDGYPYILPLNFGLKAESGVVELYFHGALEGTKYALIEADGRAGFEMDCGHELVTDGVRGSCTMKYESVVGRGRVEMVPEEEKYDALCTLMQHYHKEDFPFQQGIMPQTQVFKLVVEEMTGKRR